MRERELINKEIREGFIEVMHGWGLTKNKKVSIAKVEREKPFKRRGMHVASEAGRQSAGIHLSHVENDEIRMSQTFLGFVIHAQELSLSLEQ